MRKMKRLVTLLLAVMMVGMLSTSAFAASKTYVPASGTVYYMSGGTLGLHELDFQATYNKKGKIKSVVSITDKGVVTTQTFKWKKDYLVGYSLSVPADENYYTSWTRKFDKKNRLKSETGYSMFNGVISSSYVETYDWYKKRRATVTHTEMDNKGRVTYSYVYAVTLNKKMKVASVQNTDGTFDEYTYYKNGNLKNITDVGDNNFDVKSYDKKGYITNRSVGISGSEYMNTYEYKNNKKKKAPSVITDTYVSYPRKGKATTEIYRIEIKSYKAVNQVRNCDAYGGEGLPLGVNELVYGG